jgi:TRAP-type C4-dicarboxylate transport system permease large subunit
LRACIGSTFILTAELMSGGALTEVLLKFAAQFVGHRRGGLGYTNVASLTLFSVISGSALADAAGPGAMMIRMMDKAGYDRAYAAALTAATAIVGPIIPPSIIMIIYALQNERGSDEAVHRRPAARPPDRAGDGFRELARLPASPPPRHG